jgi:hypothetical protein
VAIKSELVKVTVPVYAAYGAPPESSAVTVTDCAMPVGEPAGYADILTPAKLAEEALPTLKLVEAVLATTVPELLATLAVSVSPVAAVE